MDPPPLSTQENHDLEEDMVSNRDAASSTQVGFGAIRDLSNLEGDIGRFVDLEFAGPEESVQGSLNLIHSLLRDTHSTCNNLISSNTASGCLDGKLEKCQSDMEHLRKELAYAHRCVSDLEVNLPITGSGTESDTEAQMHAEREMEITVHRLREENSRLNGQVHSLQSEIGSLRATLIDDSESSYSLSGRCEDNALFPGATLDSPGSLSLREEVEHLQDQLRRSHDALTGLKLERKRLRLEKGDLLGQVREVCASLEAKETQLRHFVLEYESAMRDREMGLRMAVEQRSRAEEERERMAANLLNSQAALAHLRHSLSQRDRQNLVLSRQLEELQGRFLLLTGQTVDSLESSSSGVSSDNSQLSATTPGSLGYSSLVSPCDVGEPTTLLTPTPSPNREQSNRLSVLDQAKELTAAFEEEDEAIPPVLMRNSSDGGRLSRIFRLSRSKSKDEAGSGMGILPNSRSCALPSTLQEDLHMVDKAAALSEARKLPLIRWKQPEILAWLELEMAFPPTVLRLAQENLKSGRVMLTLTEEEMEWSLGISSPLMRKKLKLGIQDYGAPSLAPYPLIRELGWEYVSGAFLASCGLSQYAQNFRTHLVDARVLSQITKKELEKQLGIRKRMHQNSLLRGLELLRITAFDPKALVERRTRCEAAPKDLLSWTNQRLARWLVSIDLAEFADKLPTSGIHGALVVLERSFTAETLAGCLGIPSSRKMIRKHLSAEFSALLFEARAQLHSARTTLTKSTTFAARSSLPRQPARSLSPGARHGDKEKESPKRLNGIREGTMSSTTSDLGSSIERSQHMATILGSTPTVLARPPVTTRSGYEPAMRSQAGRAGPRPHSIAVSRQSFLPSHDAVDSWLAIDDDEPRPRHFHPISEQFEPDEESARSHHSVHEDVTIAQQTLDAANETDL